MSLPGADELFRRTSEATHPRPLEPVQDTPARRGTDPHRDAAPSPVRAVPVEDSAHAGPRLERAPSGRVKHDEKITVYVTAEELLEIEQARLLLRRSLGSAVDRGRLVRAAMAMALADLDERGADGELVRRLGGS